MWLKASSSSPTIDELTRAATSSRSSSRRRSGSSVSSSSIERATAPRQKIRPTTDACWSVCFSRGCSRSMRAASTPCTVSGSSRSGSARSLSAAVRLHVQPSSISSRRISSRKNGLPSARARIAPRVSSRSPSPSSRCARLARRRVVGERARERTARSCGGRRPRSVARAGQLRARRGEEEERALRLGGSSSSRSSSVGRPSGCPRSRRRAARARRATARSVRQAGCSSTRTADGWRRSNASCPCRG